MKKSSYETLLQNIEAIDSLNHAIETTRRKKGELENIARDTYDPFSQNTDRKARADKAQVDLGVITSKLASLEQQLSEYKPSDNISLILEHQAAIYTVQAEIDHYQNLIIEQQAIIELASGQNDLTSDLLSQREELLTDIALGFDKTSELATLDTQLDTIKTGQAASIADNQKVISQAEQTINGLNRRLISPQQKRHYLQAFAPKILDSFLMAQANKAAIEYNALVETFTQKLNELVAIDILIAQLGQRNDTGLLYKQWQVKIPCISHNKPAPDVAGSGYHSIDTSASWFINESSTGIAQLKQNLIKQGVNLKLAGIQS